MKVVDASVIMKLLLSEEGSDRALDLVRHKNTLVAPNILFVEVANTLATKASISSEQIEQGLELIYDLGLQVEDIERGLLTEAAQVAKQTGTAVYDMIYAVLAQKLGVELITADKNFAQKTGFDFVKTLEG